MAYKCEDVSSTPSDHIRTGGRAQTCNPSTGRCRHENPTNFTLIPSLEILQTHFLRTLTTNGAGQAEAVCPCCVLSPDRLGCFLSDWNLVRALCVFLLYCWALASMTTPAGGGWPGACHPATLLSVFWGLTVTIHSFSRESLLSFFVGSITVAPYCVGQNLSPCLPVTVVRGCG